MTIRQDVEEYDGGNLRGALVIDGAGYATCAVIGFFATGPAGLAIAIVASVGISIACNYAKDAYCTKKRYSYC